MTVDNDNGRGGDDSFAAIADLSAEAMGHRLDGFGVNMLVRDIARTVAFMRDVLGFDALRVSEDYAVLAWRGKLFQLHADATYAAHPLPAHLPEVGLRGAGVSCASTKPTLMRPSVARVTVVMLCCSRRPTNRMGCASVFCWTRTVTVGRRRRA